MKTATKLSPRDIMARAGLTPEDVRASVCAHNGGQLQLAVPLGPRAGRHRPSIEEIAAYRVRLNNDPSLEAKFVRMRIEKARAEWRERFYKRG